MWRVGKGRNSSRSGRGVVPRVPPGGAVRRGAEARRRNGRVESPTSDEVTSIDAIGNDAFSPDGRRPLIVDSYRAPDPDRRRGGYVVDWRHPGSRATLVTLYGHEASTTRGDPGVPKGRRWPRPRTVRFMCGIPVSADHLFHPDGRDGFRHVSFFPDSTDGDRHGGRHGHPWGPCRATARRPPSRSPVTPTESPTSASAPTADGWPRRASTV